MKYLVGIIGLSFLASCSPDAGESKEKSQEPAEKVVQKEVQDTLTKPVEMPLNNDLVEDTLKTEEGLSYQVLREGSGKTIGKGGVLRFHYELKDQEGNVIKSSLKNVDPYGMKLGLELVPLILDKSMAEFKYGQKIALKVPALHPEMEKFPAMKHTVDDTLIYEVDIMEEPRQLEKEGVSVYWLYESKASKIDSGDVIGIDYFAFDSKGNIFSTSRDNGMPYEFRVGSSQVVKGLDLIFASLRQGDKVVVDIPAKLAYGSKGLVDKVGPNEPISYMLTVDYKK